MNAPEIKPIVCGIDFSESAFQAAIFADALARKVGAPLVLVHSADERGEFPDHLRARLMNDDRPRLAEQAERLRSLGLTFEEKLLRGVPEDGVAQFAAQAGARLVVVGASGMGSAWARRWGLGNTAERIAETSSVPTLVVRDATPFKAWARGERALKVVAGVDFTANSDAALRWVAELRKIGPCEVVAGYVDWPLEEATRLGVSGQHGIGGNVPTIQSVLERDVREKAVRLFGGNDVRVCVRGNWGRTDIPLAEMAVEAQADLIVVGTHQRHGLDRLRNGSVSRGILRYAPMSVACVPTPAAEPMAGPRIRECNRVLVAVDLNERHGFAAPYGYSIVKPGGTVRLVHNVVPMWASPVTGFGHEEFFPAKKETAKMDAEAETKLRALAPVEAEARGITTEVEVTESRETAGAICAAAERFGADIICVGSHTRPGFTAKLFGSVSLGVMQASRRPVLTVWPPAE